MMWEPERFRIGDPSFDESDANFTSFARARGAPALPYPHSGNPRRRPMQGNCRLLSLAAPVRRQ
eukprot:5522168-Alexandrium_andersonii.AAC.1